VNQPARALPGRVETEMREHLMAKLGQMRVARAGASKDDCQISSV